VVPPATYRYVAGLAAALQFEPDVTQLQEKTVGSACGGNRPSTAAAVSWRVKSSAYMGTYVPPPRGWPLDVHPAPPRHRLVFRQACRDCRRIRRRSGKWMKYASRRFLSVTKTHQPHWIECAAEAASIQTMCTSPIAGRAGVFRARSRLYAQS